MRLAGRLVVEVDLAIGEHQVVQRKTRRGACGRFLGRLQAVQDVVDVVAPLAQVGHGQHRRFHRNRVRHRRQPQQGLQLRIYIDAFDRELGRGLRHSLGIARHAGARNRQVMDRHLERPGFEIDGTHRDLPPQLGGDRALHLPLHQGRDCGIRQRPQHQQGTHGPGQPALPQR